MGNAPRRHVRRGFTLIEAALATAVIGLGVLGLVQLLAAGTVTNVEATELTTAVNLAGNVREVMAGIDLFDPQAPTRWDTKEPALGSIPAVKQYDDVLDFDDTSFSPPLDASRNAMSGYADWTQAISVQSVAADNVSSLRPDTTAEKTARVTVRILRGTREVYQTSWLVTAPR